MDPGTFGQIFSKSVPMDPRTAPQFLKRLVSGISDVFGSISLRLLMRLINMHVASEWEMEYSKTVGSSGTKKVDFGFLKSSPSTVKKPQPESRPSPVPAPAVNKSSPPPQAPDISPLQKFRQPDELLKKPSQESPPIKDEEQYPPDDNEKEIGSPSMDREDM